MMRSSSSVLVLSFLLMTVQGSDAIIAGSATGHNELLPAPLAFLMEILSAYAEDSLPEKDRQNWWLGMGHIGQVPREILSFSKLGHGARTICEIGFNAGHSAAAFLAHNKVATYYAFDAMTNPYSQRSMALFHRHFGERFKAIKGWSYSTVPWFKQFNITCDVFSIDGDHTYDGALTDTLNALEVMDIGGLIVADDTTERFAGCKQAFNDLVSNGYLRDPVCEDGGLSAAEAKGWCYAYVASKTGPLKKVYKVETTDLKFEEFGKKPATARLLASAGSKRGFD